MLVLAKTPATYHQVRTELQKTYSKELVSWVNGLVKASGPTRMVGRPGHTMAREYIEETILKLDAKKTGKMTLSTFAPDVNEAKLFYQKDFDKKVEGKFSKQSPEYLKWSLFTTHMKEISDQLKSNQGENIIWEKEGLDMNKVLVVTAHYDTISHHPQTLLVQNDVPMPGANYNASGVAVALGLIQHLAQMDLNYSVQVVFLDWQGVGFLGSYHHAQQLKSSGKKILGVINLEMLGQDTSYFDKTKKIGNMSLYLRPVSEEEKFAKKLVEHGSKIDSKVTFEMRANSFENSDNIRYWEKDLVAVTFSQNWEDDFNPKFYQTPLDTPETLNHDTLHHAYQYIGGAVLGTLLEITK